MKSSKSKQKPNIKKPLKKSENEFPVVGVGASAGGLNAFKELLKAIPKNSGMAYVLVQHLDPNHESLLPELLQKTTKIPVREISDDITVEPNNIYIIPSNKMLLSNDGKLELSARPKPEKNMLNLPINLFFTSLAEVHQAHSIGVVLSGTGSDGTLGLKAIKGHGGITMAQDEESSEYDGMPSSAAQAGVVDFILPPNKMPQKLLEITKIINGKDSGEDTVAPEDGEVFTEILSLLNVRKGTDFTHYKQTTIRRRILRRMALHKKKTPKSYLDFLRKDKKEQDILYHDLLIQVTEFFRDKKTFEHLCETVFPKIVKNKGKNDPIRVWSAGCSTGQEAYSIAMCFKEVLDSYAYGTSGGKVQIFATDISETAIAKARKAEYSKNEVEGMDPQRLKEFFTKTNGTYQLKKEIREMCVFAEHNFLKDPPFGKMDFISCRNVLIYMQPYLQKKALTSFHYALNSGSNSGKGQTKGFLLLGKSEGGTGVTDLFVPLHKKDKLFERKNGVGKFMHVMDQRPAEAHLSGKIEEHNYSGFNNTSKNENKQTDFQKTADDLLLRKYTPSGVVVNEASDIVYFHGSTGNYLEQQAGKPNHNLFKMAKDGLGFELRSILHKSKKEGAPVRKEDITIQINGNQQHISIEAVPLPHLAEPHTLILFQPRDLGANSGEASEGKAQTIKKNPRTSKEKRKEDEKDHRIKQLENELAQVRHDMRGISEEQEAANEELQSANEELMSGNEELQSLTEELETGKEELQSTNEELTVVNQELLDLNAEITSAKKYSEAVIETIREPLLILDKNLRAISANKNFYKTFKVEEGQTEGKLIYEIGNKQWDIPELRTLLANILPEKESFSDFEVTHDFQNIGTRTMVLNARRIISTNDLDDRILLAIEDITELKKTGEKNARLSAIVESSTDAIIGKTLGGTVTSWNSGAERIFGYNSKETLGKHISIIIPPEHQQEEEMILDTVKKGGKVNEFESVRITKDGKKVPISITGSAVKDAEGKIIGVSEISRDITERKQMENALRESENHFREMINALPAAIYTTDAKGLLTHYNPAAVEFAGRTPELGTDEWCVSWKLQNPNGTPMPHDECPMAVALKEGRPIRGMEGIAERPDGTKRWFMPFPTPLRDTEGHLVGGINMLVDITERKENELSNALLSAVVNGSDDAIISKKLDGTITSWNKGAEKILGYRQKEMVGKNILLIIPPEKKKEEDTIIKKIKRGEIINHFEAVRLTKDGKRIPLSLTISPIKDSKGKIIGASKIARDITEQKEAVRKIEDSEHRYQEMIYSSPSLIATFKGKDMIIEIANDAILESWGKGKNLIGKSLFSVMPEIKEQGFDKILKDVYETGEPFKAYEMPIELLQNGIPKLIYYNFTYYPQKDATGEIIGLVVIATEATPQAVFNKKLKESESHYRQMADLMPGKVLNTDEEGNAYYFNRHWLSDTGKSHEELEGRSWQKCIHPDDFETFMTAWKESLKTGKDFEMEFRCINENGKYKWYLGRAVPIKNEEGKIKIWINSAIEIQKFKDEEKRKEDFLKMVSHELKTPVTSIKGYVQMLLNMLQEGKEEQLAKLPLKPSLERIDNQIGRLTRLISEMLDLSRLEDNKFDFKNNIFSINELVDETIQDINHSNTGQKIKIEHKFKCSINADKDRIGQVLINLITNSIKYSSNNPTVEIKVEKGKNLPTGQAGNYVTVSVKDHGIGISKNDVKRIFDRFYRVEGENEDTYSGFGIGLFLSNEIVQRHNGTFSVKSKKGEGSVFSFSLPCVSKINH